MKLFDVPRNTQIRLLETIENNRVPPDCNPLRKGRVLNFDHIDGMFSFCKTLTGDTVHPSCMTEVELVPEH